jgi:flagellar biosynthesis protein FlhG
VKPLADQDHYEVLDVGREASPEEIERAYRVAQATYAEDSLAVYSVFGEEDSAALRQRVESAFQILSSRETRRAYDAWLSGGDEPDAIAAPLDDDLARETLALASEPAPAPVSGRSLPPISSFSLGGDDDADGEDPGLPLDGPRLRRTRLRRGIELEQIAAITKISPTYLRFLEEERFDDLPAPVYVRGFVLAYMRCLGIDPSRGPAEYMARYDAGRASSAKPRTQTGR